MSSSRPLSSRLLWPSQWRTRLTQYLPMPRAFLGSGLSCIHYSPTTSKNWCVSHCLVIANEIQDGTSLKKFMPFAAVGLPSHIYIYTYIYIYMCVCVSVSVCMYVCVCIRAYLHIFSGTCLYSQAPAWSNSCPLLLWAWPLPYVCVCVCVYMHTYIYSQAPAWSYSCPPLLWACPFNIVEKNPHTPHQKDIHTSTHTHTHTHTHACMCLYTETPVDMCVWNSCGTQVMSLWRWSKKMRRKWCGIVTGKQEHADHQVSWKEMVRILDAVS